MRILRIDEVIERVGIARATIYRQMKREDFPSQVKLGARSVGWIEQDINDWIRSRIAVTSRNPSAPSHVGK